MEQETSKRSRKNNSKGFRMYVVWLVILILLAGAVYGAYKYMPEYFKAIPGMGTAQIDPQSEEAIAQAEAEKQSILGELGKLMVLPEGDPVLFKVSDEETMKKQQAFFKDTKNDDVLLVFQASSKAIIYRPSSKMIINVGPVNFDQTKEQPADTKEVTKKVN